MLRHVLCPVTHYLALCCASGGCLTNLLIVNRRICLYINVAHTRNVASGHDPEPVDVSGDISSASSDFISACMFV